MITSRSDILHEAKQAIQARDKHTARLLLQQAIHQEPRNPKAWAWLAAVTSSPTSSLDYARQAAKLAPDDPFVRKVMIWAEGRAPAADLPARPVMADGRHRDWQKFALWGSIATLLILLVILGGIAVWSVLGATRHASAETAVAQIADASVEPADAQEEPAASPPAKKAPEEIATPLPYLPAKNIAANHTEKNAPRPTWTPTPIPTNTPVPTPTALPTFVSPTNAKPATRPFGVGVNERWVDVDLTTQTLTAFEGDIPVLTTLISSGTWDHPTVTGQFRIWLRYESQTMDGRLLGYDYYLEDVPFVMYFYQDYALHGTYWHNNFGTPMSHGCVNMRTEDAGWLFDWSSMGTLVNVHY